MSVRVDVDATKALLRTLRSHDANEGALLEAYRAVAEGDPDPGVRYLAQLIIDDEERHHALLEEMASQVESWANGVGGPGTPPLSPRVDRALLETTRQLIAREREDAKELRRLRRDLHQVAKTSLLPLLVELMLHDTAKHIEILHFVRDYTG